MKLVFAGSPDIAAQALKRIAKIHEVTLVLTMPDSPVGRKRIITETPVAAAAAELGIHVLKTKRITEEVLESLSTSGAEKAIVLAYGALLPQSALELFPWLNLHFSALPLWRGATPLQHSILTGQGQGYTIFQLDQGMDTGPVLHKAELELDENRTSGELLVELTDLGVSKILEILEHNPATEPQTGDATYAPKLSRPDARLNFDKRSGELHRMVMAYNPEPMAWCLVAGNPMRILRTKSLGETNWDAVGETALVPGELELEESRVLVACGAGTRLELLEVQPAGKKQMSALDWSRGLDKGLRLD